MVLNLQMKTYYLLAAAVVINLLLVVGVRKYNPLQWRILDDNYISNKVDEWRGSQAQSAVKYDFNMHVKYRLQVLQTEMKRLAKTKDCASVMADPVSFWRSRISNSTNFTSDIDLERLTLANKCTTIPIADFLATPPLPALYSFETEYLEDPPVTNISKVSNESTTSVILANSSSTFFIGDTVALFIAVKDGEGHPKSKGGDEIRAWFTDVSSSNSTLPAKITDYGNGTYLATAVLAFVGTFRAYAALVYSREYIQSLFLTQLMIKSSTIYLGAFENSQASETAVCLHVPVIPGAKPTEVCNVSEVNGTPWFCGRPVKPWLKCTDYVKTRKMRHLLTMPMNEAERLLMTRENKMFTIPAASNIALSVVVRSDNKNLTRLMSSTNCSSIPPRLTWEQPEPTGYMYKGLWHSYICRRPELVTTACLRNMHVRWAGLDWIKASNKVIDEIPNNGRYIIHIHHYLHATSSHVSAHVIMMTAIKESLVRLLQRNPDVTVIIHGPHVAWELGSRISYLQGDTLRRVYTDIHFELFKDMRDQIFYLQTADITIGSQNDKAHPPLNWQIANMMTGLICGRQ